MEKIVYISIPVAETTRRNFKAAVALKGETMQEMLRGYVEFYIEMAACEMARKLFQ